MSKSEFKKVFGPMFPKGRPGFLKDTFDADLMKLREYLMGLEDAEIDEMGEVASRHRDDLFNILEPIEKRIGFLWKSCDTCKEERRNTSLCARCKKSRYCSVECQRADWTVHKSVCGKRSVEPKPRMQCKK